MSPLLALAYRGNGTGWVIGRKGEIVSNSRVFSEGRNTNIVAIGAMSREGRCFLIRGILAADRERDVATGRMDVHDLPRLPVEIREAVGNAVSVIAHPSGDLFTSEEDDRGVDQGGTRTDTVC